MVCLLTNVCLIFITSSIHSQFTFLTFKLSEKKSAEEVQYDNAEHGHVIYITIHS